MLVVAIALLQYSVDQLNNLFQSQGITKAHGLIKQAIGILQQESEVK